MEGLLKSAKCENCGHLGIREVEEENHTCPICNHITVFKEDKKRWLTIKTLAFLQMGIGTLSLLGVVYDSVTLGLHCLVISVLIGNLILYKIKYPNE